MVGDILIVKAPLDHIKVNKKRRNRGYSHEDSIVDFLKSRGWQARRMGGSSTGMPDVMATWNEKDASIIYALEAKSGYDNNLYVPYDQVKRCIDMIDMFPTYNKKFVVLAFKFANKQRRPLYWYFGFDMDYAAAEVLKEETYDWIRCNSLGALTVRKKDGTLVTCNYSRKDINLPFIHHFLQ